MSRVARLAVLTALAVLGAIAESRALETDQFFAWGKPLADSTDALNRRVNAEIEAVLEKVRGKPGATCDDVERAAVSRFRYFLFQQVENWAVTSPDVDRIPRTADEVEDYRRDFVYGPRPGVDVVLWMPASPTIEAGGVRFGTDKISHFFSQGLRYHRAYHRALEKGASPEEAERHAVEWGYMVERAFLGFSATGVLSLADLEANFQGMRFWNSLCEGPAAITERTPEGWRLARPFDVRNYVNPDWDESWRPNVFGKRRWKRVRPAIEKYCPALQNPDVRTARERYRVLDGVSRTEELIRELVVSGKVPDPEAFAIRTVCGEAGALARAPASGDQSQRPARF